MKNIPVYFEDKGCNIEPSCLNCSLPVCKYDLPGRSRQGHGRVRLHVEIMTMHSQGATTQNIADAVKVTTRSVRRIILRYEKQ